MQASTNGNVAGLGCVFIFQQSCEWISLMGLSEMQKRLQGRPSPQTRKCCIPQLASLGDKYHRKSRDDQQMKRNVGCVEIYNSLLVFGRVDILQIRPFCFCCCNPIGIGRTSRGTSNEHCNIHLQCEWHYHSLFHESGTLDVPKPMIMR